MLAPLIEFVGFVIFLVLAALQLINWHTLRFLLFIIFGYLNSISILMEVVPYNQYHYQKRSEKTDLCHVNGTFLFHPF